MIKNSLVIAIALFVSYNLFLMIYKTEKQSIQYQYQGNVIKAERYMNSKSTSCNVLIGTSLSSKIETDCMINTYSLSMPGLSLFDGLNLVLEKNKFPSRLYIESNFLSKPENTEFSSLFNSKIIQFLKNIMPALRAENQPAGMIVHILKTYFTSKKKPVAEIPASAELFNEVLENQKNEFSSVNKESISFSALKLRALLIKVRARGTRIIFFEMPVNKQLEILPMSILTRSAIHLYFPEDKFIPYPNNVVRTSDGVHLTESEALTYSLFFKNQIIADTAR